MSGSGSGTSNGIVALAALVEVATGLVLVAHPAPLARWLLGVDLTGDFAPLARVAGVALFSFGIACWPGRSGRSAAACTGLLIYNVAIAAYLTFLRTVEHAGGSLLWPAVALHGVLTLLLLRTSGAHAGGVSPPPGDRPGHRLTQ